MSTVADGSDAGARPATPTRVQPAESGLRLLVTVAGSGALRWAPDPDAPDLRELAPGEARLAIRSFCVGAAARRLVVASRGSAGVPVDSWTAIPASGLAQVTESRADGAPVGSWWCGSVHVGTHLVLRAGDMAEIEPAAHPGPGAGWLHGAIGREEVERAIAAWRDGGHATVESGPMSLTDAGSSPATRPPICVASWHRPQAALRPRGLSTEPRVM